MSDLRSAVPSTDGVQDVVTEAGLTAVAATIPVLGSIISDSVRASLARRSAARQREFDLLVAERIEAIRADLDQVTALLVSDAFLSAFAKASRSAHETASEAKRVRLATAASRFAAPGGYEAVQKERLLDLVERLDDLDVLLLQYLDNPYLWLAERDPGVRANQTVNGSLLGPFFEHVPANAELRPMIEISLGRLNSEGLSNVPVNATVMSGGGSLAQSSTQAGQVFLDFAGVRLVP